MFIFYFCFFAIQFSKKKKNNLRTLLTHLLCVTSICLFLYLFLLKLKNLRCYPTCGNREMGRLADWLIGTDAQIYQQTHQIVIQDKRKTNKQLFIYSQNTSRSAIPPHLSPLCGHEIKVYGVVCTMSAQSGLYHRIGTPKLRILKRRLVLTQSLPLPELRERVFIFYSET